MEGLAASKCQAALSLEFNIDFAMGSQRLNPSCDMKRVGEVQDVMQAGWTVKDDFINKCTVLVTQVLEAILQDMHQDGTLGKLYGKMLKQKKTRTEPCSASSANMDHGRLGLMSFAGIIGFHALLAIMALSCAGIAHVRGSDQLKDPQVAESA